MQKKLYVDPEVCTGCELCVDVLPDVFEMNKKGVSVAYNSVGAGEAEIQDVIDNCPAECICWK